MTGSVRLARELTKIAIRRLPKCYLNPSADAALFPITTDLIQKLEPELWAYSPTAALRVLVQRAIALLSDVEPPHHTVSVSLRRAANIMYGFEWNGTREPDYRKDLSGHLKRIAGISEDAFPRDVSGATREKLAEILLQLEPPSQPQDVFQIPGTPEAVTINATLFVPRSSYQSALNQATAKPGVILLYGEGGFGKTTLATEYTKRVPPEKRSLLRAHSSGQLIADVRQELQRLGVDATSLTDDAAKQRFRDVLVDRKTAPLYVVIDNVEKEREIDQLLTADVQSRVLLTSRRMLHHPLIATSIHVGAMTPDEAKSLARSTAQNLTDDEADRFARLLGEHPLGITAACKLAAKNPRYIAQLLESLHHDPAGVLGTRESDSETEHNLFAVYEQTLELFQSSVAYRPALRLLEAMSCLASEDIPLDLLLRYYVITEGDEPSESHLFVCSQAITLLEERSIVVATENGLNMHPLSQAAWRAIFRGKGRMREVCLPLDKLMRAAAWDELKELTRFYSAEEQPIVDALEPFEQLPRVVLGHQRAELWDGHHEAVIASARGFVTAEEFELEDIGWGYYSKCGSRAHSLIMLSFNAEQSRIESLKEKYRRALAYFGVSPDDKHLWPAYAIERWS
ncbi:NB-ARC domain-containing protein [Streptomyces sp. NPDC005538]|uniref:NB-ARC domain-containing protein n=1 Tax=unclassified Streptomyces TaxID=2593676 RepID=UPI0033B22809